MLSSLPRQKQGNAPARITGGISLFSAWRKQAPRREGRASAKRNFVTPPGDFVRYAASLTTERINDHPSIRTICTTAQVLSWPTQTHFRRAVRGARAFRSAAGTWPSSWHPTYP